jgi:hypothetical protein
MRTVSINGKEFPVRLNLFAALNHSTDISNKARSFELTQSALIRVLCLIATIRSDL